eukprot:2271873-Prymnesium_polylepis.1
MPRRRPHASSSGERCVRAARAEAGRARTRSMRKRSWEEDSRGRDASSRSDRPGSPIPPVLAPRGS